ncbi:hypothetical protein HMPREF1548_03648 [Clostridium sp. KLE 1755]|nr:hypothetical protein HMPREF1548_03648 [Clostridium sp. KLE 1755]
MNLLLIPAFPPYFSSGAGAVHAVHIGGSCSERHCIYCVSLFYVVFGIYFALFLWFSRFSIVLSRENVNKYRIFSRVFLLFYLSALLFFCNSSNVFLIECR